MTLSNYIAVAEVLKQEGWKLDHFLPPQTAIWRMAETEISVPLALDRTEQMNEILRRAGITNRKFTCE